MMGTDLVPIKRGNARTQWRKRRAVELALAGYSYDDIAVEVGYSNRGCAWRVVAKALNENVASNVEEYRQVELARLDALMAAHWDDAVSGGNLRSADFCLKAIAQRARILGFESQSVTLAAPPMIVGRDDYVDTLKVIAGERVA